MQCFHSPDLDCQSEELGCVLLQQHHPIYKNSNPHTNTHMHVHNKCTHNIYIHCTHTYPPTVSDLFLSRWAGYPSPIMSFLLQSLKSPRKINMWWKSTLQQFALSIPQVREWLPLWLSHLQLKLYLGIVSPLVGCVFKSSPSWAMAADDS